jgi:antitoxin component of MazEF toxin-antitoxin module
MGYRVKIQKVERPTNKSFYINFPAALAEAAEIEKGEDFEWQTEDRNTFVSRRVIKAKSFVAKKKKC